jgi:2'-5' RNA ligase
MHFTIVLFPQASAQDLIHSYRKRYDPHHSLIPPHITLKEDFYLEGEQLQETVQQLAKMAEETKPFQIIFHKVSHFYPNQNKIYLAIHPSPPLMELYGKIKDIFDPTVISPARFIPHLIIGQEMTEEELHDVYGSLRLQPFTLKTTIDHFHLLYQSESGTWHIYQSFPLKK